MQVNYFVLLFCSSNNFGGFTFKNFYRKFYSHTHTHKSVQVILLKFLVFVSLRECVKTEDVTKKNLKLNKNQICGKKHKIFFFLPFFAPLSGIYHFMFCFKDICFYENSRKAKRQFSNYINYISITLL